MGRLARHDLLAEEGFRSSVQQQGQDMADDQAMGFNFVSAGALTRHDRRVVRTGRPRLDAGVRRAGLFCKFLTSRPPYRRFFFGRNGVSEILGRHKPGAMEPPRRDDWFFVNECAASPNPFFREARNVCNQLDPIKKESGCTWRP